jgi:hypothetical protein
LSIDKCLVQTLFDTVIGKLGRSYWTSLRKKEIECSLFYFRSGSLFFLTVRGIIRVRCVFSAV